MRLEDPGTSCSVFGRPCRGVWRYGEAWDGTRPCAKTTRHRESRPRQWLCRFVNQEAPGRGPVCVPPEGTQSYCNVAGRRGSASRGVPAGQGQSRPVTLLPGYSNARRRGHCFRWVGWFDGRGAGRSTSAGGDAVEKRKEAPKGALRAWSAARTLSIRPPTPESWERALHLSAVEDASHPVHAPVCRGRACATASGRRAHSWEYSAITTSCSGEQYSDLGSPPDRNKRPLGRSGAINTAQSARSDTVEIGRCGPARTAGQPVRRQASSRPAGRLPADSTELLLGLGAVELGAGPAGAPRHAARRHGHPTGRSWCHAGKDGGATRWFPPVPAGGGPPPWTAVPCSSCTCRYPKSHVPAQIRSMPLKGWSAVNTLAAGPAGVISASMLGTERLASDGLCSDSRLSDEPRPST